MKQVKKISLITIIFSALMVMTAFANQWEWENVSGHHNQSVLLDTLELSSQDTVSKYGRGDYLAEGSVTIVNLQDGTLRIDASTLAYRNVDRIIHTVFLDVWDEDEDDWINLDAWDYERTKEEVANGELYMYSTSITVGGYEVGRYYRLRGLHGVEIYDELEACATETNGVLLTDLWN